jgi:hypothetical protein
LRHLPLLIAEVSCRAVLTMPEVIATFTRKDYVVPPILDALELAGVDVMYDVKDVSSADNDRTEQRSAQTAAQCMILFWSRELARAPMLAATMHVAIEFWASDRLILVALDETPLPIGLRDLTKIRHLGGGAVERVLSEAEVLLRKPLLSVYRSKQPKQPKDEGWVAHSIGRSPAELELSELLPKAFILKGWLIDGALLFCGLAWAMYGPSERTYVSS